MKMVRDPRDLTRRVAGTAPGTSATLPIANRGARTVTLTLGRLTEQSPEAR